MIPFEKEYADNPLVLHSVDFSVAVICFCEQLEGCRKYVVAKQLLRSGTSIGANIMEAQGAESRNDFIHKLKIADKEARESAYWLLLCRKAPDYPFEENLEHQLTAIRKLLNVILKTSRENRNGQ